MAGWEIWQWALLHRPHPDPEVQEASSPVEVAYPRVPVGLLKDLSSALPPCTWITSVVLTSSGELSLQGVAFSPLRVWELLEHVRAFAPSLTHRAPKKYRSGELSGG
ncbi:MAG TPA: hypothetical protein EYP17_03530 [Candidatus Latescibacteria bacterium]|nr:hypothetical protein [Candidatus Latescibacterota bacterium]